MSWLSGKDTVYKFHPQRVTSQQQKEFLRDYVGLNKSQIKELKKSTDNNNLLSLGRTINHDDFIREVKKVDNRAKEKFQDFVKDKTAALVAQQEARRRANIKRTRELEMKKEMADEAIKQMLHMNDKEPAQTTSIFDKIRQQRRQYKDLTKEEKKELARIERKMAKRLEFMHIEPSSWQHAEKGKQVTVHDTRKGTDQADGKIQKESHWSKGSDDENTTSKSDKNRETVDIDKLKEQSRNLPDLQI